MNIKLKPKQMLEGRFLWFRITVGLFCLYKFFSFAPFWLDFFSEEGLFSREVIEVNNGTPLVSFFSILEGFSSLFQMSSNEVSLVICGVSLLGSISLILGFCSRLSVLLLLLINMSLTNTFMEYAYGVDYFLTSTLFYALFFPLGFSFSVDYLIQRKFPLWAWNSRYHLSERTAMLWLGLHLCIVYFIGGFAKALGPTWWNGEAIWKALHRPGNEWAMAMGQQFLYKPLFVGLGIVTIVVELLYAICIWHRKTRALWLFLTLGMHLFIGVFLELHFFAAVMIFLNMIAFGKFTSREQIQFLNIKLSS